jgi:hypothetical protein
MSLTCFDLKMEIVWKSDKVRWTWMKDVVELIIVPVSTGWMWWIIVE